MAGAVERARTLGRLTMTREAASVWGAVYHHLSAERPGLLGAILGRAEAQTLRLAVIYAALDNSQHIDVAHLHAALAVWQYCEDSAAQIFGEALGDEVADTILASLIPCGQGWAVENRDLHAVRPSRLLRPHRTCTRPPASPRQSQTGDNPDIGPPRGKMDPRRGGRAMRYLDLVRTARERSEICEIRGSGDSSHRVAP